LKEIGALLLPPLPERRIEHFEVGVRIPWKNHQPDARVADKLGEHG
jgi:hypothetical protein